MIAANLAVEHPRRALPACGTLPPLRKMASAVREHPEAWPKPTRR
jgi:hypothetical protein